MIGMTQQDLLPKKLEFEEEEVSQEFEEFDPSLPQGKGSRSFGRF